VDLELTDEQRWLSESVETLLTREWTGSEGSIEAGEAERRLWEHLVQFGALTVDREEGLGVVELCLVARAIGAHLAPVPYLGSTAVRFAAEPFVSELPEAFGGLAAGGDSVSVALLEPGRGWSLHGMRTTFDGIHLEGAKAAVEHAGEVDRLAVVAAVEEMPGLALVSTGAAGLEVAPQPSFDPTVPMSGVTLRQVDAVVAQGAVAAELVARLLAAGALIAAADAIGAAARLLQDASAYAGERRQFGRTIGSNQALRHLMADMYVRQESSWSTVLYAAAALDDGLEGALETAAVAKAYVSRAAREVAHGAMQVFGGIAFTAEHPSHRFLRRILVREQQFGDAAHHERELGRALARRAEPRSAPAAAVPLAPTT
jgi:alkylation response protein AidB-like acyl-CoA dehydrogenase